jgi:glycosyltransferase involved in cell wall biosynthesis
MRVLMLAEELRSLGGVEQSSFGLAKRLAGAGHDIDLVYGREGDISDQWFDVCRRRLALGSVMLPRRRQPARTCMRVLRTLEFCARFPPEVIYCQTMYQLPLGRAVSRTMRRPVVLHLRSGPPAASRANLRRLHGVSRAISVSASTAEAWTERFPGFADRITVIPNGVDLERFHPVSKQERADLRSALGLRDVFTVAYAGRFSPEKGTLDLIEAFLGAGSEVETQLALVGDIDPRFPEYGSSVQAAASPVVVVLPPTAHVERVMQAADLVVVPSHREAFGRVVVEALACGVSVFGGRVGGIAEILADVPHLLFTPGDTRELGMKISGLAVEGGADTPPRTPEALRAMAAAYSEPEVAKRVESVLAEVAMGRSPSRR